MTKKHLTTIKSVGVSLKHEGIGSTFGAIDKQTLLRVKVSSKEGRTQVVSKV
jgi:hypothetical protein